MLTIIQGNAGKAAIWIDDRYGDSLWGNAVSTAILALGFIACLALYTVLATAAAILMVQEIGMEPRAAASVIAVAGLLGLALDNRGGLWLVAGTFVMLLDPFGLVHALADAIGLSG